MNTTDHNWEVDIRQKVEHHEFEFDPKAWEAMEQVLDTSSISSEMGGSESSIDGLNGGIWKVLLLVLSLGLLFYWLTKRENRNEPVLSSFSVQKTIEEISPKTLTPLPPKGIDESLEKPNKTRLRSNDRLTSSLKKDETTEAQLAVEPIINMTHSSALEVSIVAPLVSKQKIPLLKRRAVPLQLEVQPAAKTRRRRDRHKMFPDVIRRY